MEVQDTQLGLAAPDIIGLHFALEFCKCPEANIFRIIYKLANDLTVCCWVTPQFCFNNSEVPLEIQQEVIDITGRCYYLTAY
jgi:hypothetical protein